MEDSKGTVWTQYVCIKCERDSDLSLALNHWKVLKPSYDSRNINWMSDKKAWGILLTYINCYCNHRLHKEQNHGMELV